MKSRIKILAVTGLLAMAGLTYGLNSSQSECPMEGTPNCPKIDCPLAGTPDCPYELEAAAPSCCMEK
jgi:hypothetical protein